VEKSWKVILSKTQKQHAINKGLTSFINPFSLLLLNRVSFKVEKINYWYIDGISLVYVVNFLFGKKLTRNSFDDTSIAPYVFKHAKDYNLRVALIGTEKHYIKNAVDVIELKYKIKVTYFRDGFIKSEQEKNDTFNEIMEKGIDVVICGMGTPRQEKFLIDLLDYGWNGYGYTCGGFFHQIAKKADYYPNWIDNYNIRWVYRIYDEPKLFKRYFVQYPIFFLKFLIFWLKYKLKFTVKESN